jgi:hypothetical protein
MQAVLTRFTVEDGSIELILGSKVPKDDRLGNTCCLGDLLCGRSLKASARKKVHGGLQYLLAAKVGGHASGGIAIKNLFDQKRILLS